MICKNKSVPLACFVLSLLLLLIVMILWPPGSGETPNTDDLSWRPASKAATICRDIYREPAEKSDSPVVDRLARHGFVSVVPVANGATFAAICSNEKDLFVCFRGTDTAADWIINADLRRTTYKGGELHRGFFNALDGIYDELIAECHARGGRSKKIYVTGHSLGGGLAAIFAIRAHLEDDCDVEALITFGQPLLLDTALAERANDIYGDRYLRFVNGKDIVTRLLPTFRHAGSRVQLSNSQPTQQKPGVSIRDVSEAVSSDEPMDEVEFEELKQKLQDEMEQDELPASRGGVRGQIPLLADHSMLLYAERIERFVLNNANPETKEIDNSTDGKPGERSNKLALLVGINDYDAVTDLNGCVNDVTRMRTLLQNRFGFETEDIKILTNKEASGEAIVSAFQNHLIANSSSDTVAVFHFSGHGSQMKDQADGDETDKLDETIVPCDSRTEGKYDISDDALNGLLSQLADKTKNIAVILDCCHSGDGTRDLAVPRIIPPDEREPPKAPDFALGETRSVVNSSLIAPQSGAILYACRSDEYAYELSFNQQAFGALSHYFIEAINETDGTLTYQDVIDQVQIDVTAKFPRQHPTLVGTDSDKFLFEIESQASGTYALASPEADEVVLNIGSVHGVTVGSKFAVFEPGTKFAKGTTSTKPVAEVVVDEVSFSQSSAPIPADVKIKSASRAIEIEHAYADLEFTVMVGHPKLKPDPESNEENALKAIHDLLTSDKAIDESQDNAGKFSEHFGVTNSRQEAKLFILARDNTVGLFHGDDDANPASPMISIDNDNENFLARLTSQLVAWTKWYRITGLNNALTGPAVDFKVMSANGDVMKLKSGNRINFTVRNLNDKPIYFTILDLSTDGEVGVLYKSDKLTDGDTWSESTRVRVPKGREQIRDYFKLIVTETPVSFDFLKQNAPRDPLTGRSLGVKADSHPLAKLIADRAFVTKQADEIVVSKDAWSERMVVTETYD